LNGRTVPGWVLQTRGTYELNLLQHSSLSNIVFALILPLIVLAVVVAGLRRYRETWVVATAIAGCGFLAYYAGSKDITGTNLNCSYCIDRNLLPTTPGFIFLIGVGLSALVLSASLIRRGGALMAAIVVVLALGHALAHEMQRFSQRAFFLDTSVGTVISHHPSGSSRLLLEGFNEGPDASVEEVAVAQEAEERFWNHVTFPADFSDNYALAYVGAAEPIPGPQFNGSYGYVLTRIPGLSSGRSLVSRVGGVALYRRSRSLDVTVDSGVVVGWLQDWPSGRAIVNPSSPEPLELVVSGIVSSAVAIHLQLTTDLGKTLSVATSDGHGLVVMRDRDAVDICVQPRILGGIGVVHLEFSPKSGIELGSLSATSSGCRGVSQ
jgi:hypothetical protein